MSKDLKSLSDSELAKYKASEARKKATWPKKYSDGFLEAELEEARRRDKAIKKHEAEIAELTAKKEASREQEEQHKLRIRGIRAYGAHEI